MVIFRSFANSSELGSLSLQHDVMLHLSNSSVQVQTILLLLVINEDNYELPELDFFIQELRSTLLILYSQ